jgi:hypothetical protein
MSKNIFVFVSSNFEAVGSCLVCSSHFYSSVHKVTFSDKEFEGAPLGWAQAQLTNIKPG